MKYKYMGDCAAGFVEFNRPNVPDEPSVVMPAGEAVEVPSWLEGKLKTNSHFEQAKAEAVKIDTIADAKPKPSKKTSKKKGK